MGANTSTIRNNTPSEEDLKTAMIVMGVIWAVISLIITLVVTFTSQTEETAELPCWPWFDNRFKCLKFCRGECFLVPFYFLFYFVFILTFLAWAPVYIAGNCLYGIPFFLAKYNRIETCCGKEIPDKWKIGKDLEAGGRGQGGGGRCEVPCGRSSERGGAEQATVLTMTVVTQPPQPEAPMVAAVKPGSGEEVTPVGVLEDQTSPPEYQVVDPRPEN
ncbi:hypothetical protein QBC40DRAFT_330361 [Triangularia verruculosa]|uniref:Transmembrane protein n=1 Tax=Triangularia verruculosa TaxID=2587418 RepID=A0AAN7ARV8_9PEZI|nr:hypothetical protein QBC40DRAFT_330361 [Triangularia verruculosa]